MRKRWAVAGAAVVAAAAVTAGLAATTGDTPATGATQEPPVNTGTVQRGILSQMVSQSGVLTYQARPDGSPYAVINRASGTYTKLPETGDRVDCGDVLYRVDEKPVLLLCGATPAFRSLSQGERGPDVSELNANLVHLGYATSAQLDPSSDHFGPVTTSALEKLQAKRRTDHTGSLTLGQAVFLPGPVRIAKMTGQLGAPAQPGAQVAQATSDTLEVQVNLDPSQHDEVKIGDRAQITLPDNTPVPGKVARLGPVVPAPTGQSSTAGGASIPVYISLDHPEAATGLDQAPVHVAITTKGVENALSVPVAAIVGKSGGGYAVDVVRGNGRREQVPVKLGLIDSTAGRVQVDGALRVGDRVVVPGS